MKIKEIHPLTLIDYPGKLACTIFVFGCNFKCGFCYNANLVLREDRPTMPEEEILDFLEKRKDYLNGVCFTGGEPLMSLDVNLLHKIRALGYSIKIDTNGSFPEQLNQLIELGLIDYAAMDIKSSPEKYPELTNSKFNQEKIEESIRIVSGLKQYEFRITIVEGFHTEEEIKKISKWLHTIIGWKPKKFVLQGFNPNIGSLIDKKFHGYKETSEKYLNDLKDVIKEYFEEVEIRV